MTGLRHSITASTMVLALSLPLFAQTTATTDTDSFSPLQAMFAACLASDATTQQRSLILSRSGWQPAPVQPATRRKLVEQLTIRADRGDPPNDWATMLSVAEDQANAFPEVALLFTHDGDVPSLLTVHPNATTGGVICGYSASDSSREALQLLLGVGKDPSEQSGGTLTIRAAVTVRAVVQDRQSHDWQIEASSHFADPTEITAETGEPFSTAFALTIALQPVEN